MSEIKQVDREAAALLGDAVFCHPDIVAQAFASHREAAEQGMAEMVEALTPSGDTKAAYMGEFSFMIPQAQEDDDGEPIEVQHRVYVPWTTIKEIMAAIRERAALQKARKP